MLTTYLTERRSLRYPILNASMTLAAAGALARAVSAAGGLGMPGVTETRTAEDIEHGQSAGLIDGLVGAADVVRDFGDGAEDHQRSRMDELFAKRH